MNVNEYRDWKDLPADHDPNWRAPIGFAGFGRLPRRRGVFGTLSALVARFR